MRTIILAILLMTLAAGCQNKNQTDTNSFGLQKLKFDFKSNSVFKIKNIILKIVSNKETSINTLPLCGSLIISAPDVKPKLLLNQNIFINKINQNFDKTKKLGIDKGEIFIELTINCKGEAGNYKAVKTDIPALNIQLVTLIHRFGKWKPGIFQDKPCDSRLTLHFAFLHGKVELVNNIN